jgi:hypothetical protein
LTITKKTGGVKRAFGPVPLLFALVTEGERKVQSSPPERPQDFVNDAKEFRTDDQISIIISLDAKKFSEVSLSLLYLKGHNHFSDSHRTSQAVPFGPPTLTLPLRRGKGRVGVMFLMSFFATFR